MKLHIQPKYKQLFIFLTDNVIEVPLVKGSSGLGFSVLNEKDVPDGNPSKGLPRIKKIFPLGAAMDSGKLEVGDVILEVNGKSVKDMTHAVGLKSC